MGEVEGDLVRWPQAVMVEQNKTAKAANCQLRNKGAKESIHTRRK
jgi:hypothetical protein